MPCEIFILMYISYIDGNVSKPRMTFDENEIFRDIVLILFSVKCQWFVPKFECKVYQNGKNRSIKYSVVSLFCAS